MASPPSREITQVSDQDKGLLDIAANAPVKLANIKFTELKDTEPIMEDLRTGTIRHSFAANGSPKDARINEAMDGFKFGAPHPWFEDAFFVKWTIKYISHSSVPEDRFSRIDIFYQRRVCPGFWTLSGTSSLQATSVWWFPASPFTVPQKIGTVLRARSILRPLELVTLSRPAVLMTSNKVRALFALQGRRNLLVGFPFDEPSGFWLVQNVAVQQLTGRSGSVGDDIGKYDVSISLKGDPWRRHDHWSARSRLAETDDEGNLLPGINPDDVDFVDGVPNLLVGPPASGSYADMAAVHKVRPVFPKVDDQSWITDIIPEDFDLCSTVAFPSPPT